MKKQELDKSNLQAEEDFSQKMEGLNLHPWLKKPLTTYKEVFGALTSPVGNWSKWTENKNLSLRVHG